MTLEKDSGRKTGGYRRLIWLASHSLGSYFAIPPIDSRTWDILNMVREILGIGSKLVGD